MLCAVGPSDFWEKWTAGGKRCARPKKTIYKRGTASKNPVLNREKKRPFTRPERCIWPLISSIHCSPKAHQRKSQWKGDYQKAPAPHLHWKSVVTGVEWWLQIWHFLAQIIISIYGERCYSERLQPSVEHGRGSVMVLRCISTTGDGTCVKTGKIMNTEKYCQILFTMYVWSQMQIQRQIKLSRKQIFIQVKLESETKHEAQGNMTL